MRLPYAALPDLVAAVERRQIITFTHKARAVKAEPHMIGQHRKTGAFVLVAWVLGPEAGWQRFRFCEVRGLAVGLDFFDQIRDGFDPHDRYFGGTLASVARQPAAR